MPPEKISDVVRFGLDYERARVEVASHNLAMANVALAPGAASPLLSANVQGGFSSQVGLPAFEVQAAAAPQTRVVHDPTHPLADSAGMVHYPQVDPATEMATLVSATRAYEANIRAYNSLRAMKLKAFEIGK